MHLLTRSAVWLCLFLWQQSGLVVADVASDGLGQTIPAIQASDQGQGLQSSDSPGDNNQATVPNDLDLSKGGEAPLSGPPVVPQADKQDPQADGQDTQTDDQDEKADDQDPQTDDQGPQTDDQDPQTDDQDPQTDDQDPQTDNKAPETDDQAPQADKQADEKAPHADKQADEKAPQADKQAPQANKQAPKANKRVPKANKQVPKANRQVPKANKQAKPPAARAKPPSPPVPASQIKPTHVASSQMRPPVAKSRPPPPPPPQAPRPSARGPPPPPPSGSVPRGVPSFLVPSSDAINAFDGAEANFVYILPSRGRQCFHHRSSKPFMFEFHVLHGGKLDINAYIVGPDGRIIYESRDRRQGRYVASSSPTAVEKLTADSKLPLYTVCLDNRYSSWYAKVVDFSIETSRARRGDGKAKDPVVAVGPLSEELTTELVRLNMSWAQFLELTNAVEGNLQESASLQRQFRSDETRDRMAMEDSASCVTNWSLLQLLVMTGVSALQVLMIRALFDEKSLFHRVWKSKEAFAGRS